LYPEQICDKTLQSFRGRQVQEILGRIDEEYAALVLLYIYSSCSSPVAMSTEEDKGSPFGLVGWFKVVVQKLVSPLSLCSCSCSFLLQSGESQLPPAKLSLLVSYLPALL
jgi:hypothetical protein